MDVAFDSSVRDVYIPMVNRIAEKVTVAFLCDSIGGNGNTTKSTRKRELPLHLVPQNQTLPDTKEEKIGKEEVTCFWSMVSPLSNESSQPTMTPTSVLDVYRTMISFRFCRTENSWSTTHSDVFT